MELNDDDSKQYNLKEEGNQEDIPVGYIEQNSNHEKEEEYNDESSQLNKDDFTISIGGITHLVKYKYYIIFFLSL